MIISLLIRGKSPVEGGSKATGHQFLVRFNEIHQPLFRRLYSLPECCSGTLTRTKIYLRVFDLMGSSENTVLNTAEVQQVVP